MGQTTWQHYREQAQSDPYLHAALTLLLLNGLTIPQLERLAEAAIDLEQGWLTTHDGHTFPLVSYAVESLTALMQDGRSLDPARLLDVTGQLTSREADAHRRLAGAIWITDETLKLTLETAGISGVGEISGETGSETRLLPLSYTFPFSIAERLQPGETSAVAIQARQVLQTAADWLVAQTLTPQISLIQRLFGLVRQGSLVFLVASTGVSGLNLIHNVLMGRLLSPADYSQLTFVITLQLLIGLLPTILQTVTARFTARYQVQAEPALLRALQHSLGRTGMLIGIGLALVLLAIAPLLTAFFHLDGVHLLLPLVVVLPFFIHTGVDRGFLQGTGGYLWLSLAYVVEGVIRLGAGVILGYALLEAGRSLDGAVWGLAQSMLFTWFIAWLALRHLRLRAPVDRDLITAHRRDWLHLGWLMALALIGQALITNSDFLLVKNFFSPQDAGLYAAISVLGRIVYFGALPLTLILVPLIARRQALNEPTRPILLLLIGGGTMVCTLLMVVAAIFAPNVLHLLYGEAYVPAASLLAPYALAASLYTLTSLVITYQIALGSGGETWMPILAGSAQIALILLFHESLAQVITVQIGLMGILFVVVLWRVLRPTPLTVIAETPAVEVGA